MPDCLDQGLRRVLLGDVMSEIQRKGITQVHACIVTFLHQCVTHYLGPTLTQIEPKLFKMEVLLGSW